MPLNKNVRTPVKLTMSSRNIETLVQLVMSDPAVCKKLLRIDRSTVLSTAVGLSRLSLEIGHPFSVEEFLATQYGLKYAVKAC